MLNRRVNTPTILQMEAVECGAASLGMVLAHHGLHVPLEKLRADCGVSRDGSKASNILKAAQRYNLEAEGYAIEDLSGLDDIQLPAIVFWDFNHFLVYEGHRRGKIYLNDPAMGGRKLTTDEFSQRFTGVVLELKPAKSFETGGARQSFLPALRSYVASAYGSILFFLLTGLFLVVPGLLIPVFSRIFIDNVLVEKLDGWILPIIMGMGLTAVFRGFFTALQKYYFIRFGEKLSLSSSIKLVRHLLRLPVSYFQQRYIGDIASRIALNQEIAAFMSGNAATTMLNCIMIVFFLAVMFQYHVTLTIIGIGISLINVLFLAAISPTIANKKMRLLQDYGVLSGVLVSGLSMVDTLKAGGSEDDLLKRYTASHGKSISTEQEMGLFNVIIGVVPAMLTTLNTSIILLYGSFEVMNGQLTMGMLVAFQSLMASYIAPVNSLVTLGGAFQEIKASLKRVEDVLLYPADPELDKDTQDSDTNQLTGAIELRDVTFSYGSLDEPVVKNVSLQIEPGSRVAIVGASGSGKTSLARLIRGLYQPQKGQILFDGKPRGEIARLVLTSSIADVDQDTAIFAASIKDNITLWDTGTKDQHVLIAAKDALLHEDVMKKKGGYDHVMLENGQNFSGGQRQRLEIARALARNPSILVLDEATSALDPVTEMMIDRQIRRRGCTTVIIAHRLSTIRDSDEIVVLSKGRIVERGTHEQLMKIDGHYAALIDAE